MGTALGEVQGRRQDEPLEVYHLRPWYTGLFRAVKPEHVTSPSSPGDNPEIRIIPSPPTHHQQHNDPYCSHQTFQSISHQRQILHHGLCSRQRRTQARGMLSCLDLSDTWRSYWHISPLSTTDWRNVNSVCFSTPSCPTCVILTFSL